MRKNDTPKKVVATKKFYPKNLNPNVFSPKSKKSKKIMKK